MKKLLVLLMTCVFSYTAHSAILPFHMPKIWEMHRKEIPALTEQQKRIVARITFYTNYEEGGNRIASSNKGRAKEGLTIAAHPDFKFGTKVHIPALKGKVGNGNFVIEDRGSAVTKKKASHGKYYVFDVYLHANSRKEAKRKILEMTRSLGDYAVIDVG